MLTQALKLTNACLPAGQESFHALYYKDGIHPSAVGTYLESCVMSSVISGEDWSSPMRNSPLHAENCGCYHGARTDAFLPPIKQAEPSL